MGDGNTETQNRKTIFRTEKNSDGTPVKEVTPTD